MHLLRHSLIRDPPFSRIDLICCRNLLIYLDARTCRQRAAALPLRAPARWLSVPRQLRERVAARRPVRGDRQEAPHLPAPDTAASIYGCHFCLRLELVARFGRGRAPGAPAAGAARAPHVEARVAERFAPAHVVVNLRRRRGPLLVAHRQVSRGGAGHPSRQLLAMARKGLRLDLRSALQEAIETRRHGDARAALAVELDHRVQLVEHHGRAAQRRPRPIPCSWCCSTISGRR